MLYLLLLPLALLAPAGRHRRRRRPAPRPRPYTRRITWTCPLCWRTLATIGASHTCTGREVPEVVPNSLFTRRRLVTPAYENWENRRTLQRGDGLDDLRADLGPLVRQLVTGVAR